MREMMLQMTDQRQMQQNASISSNARREWKYGGAQVSHMEESKQTARRMDDTLRETQAVIEELRSKINFALESANETMDRLDLSAAEEMGGHE